MHFHSKFNKILILNFVLFEVVILLYQKKFKSAILERIAKGITVVIYIIII